MAELVVLEQFVVRDQDRWDPELGWLMLLVARKEMVVVILLDSCKFL